MKKSGAKKLRFDPQIEGLMTHTIMPALSEDFDYKSKKGAEKILANLKMAVNAIELEAQKDEDFDIYYTFTQAKKPSKDHMQRICDHLSDYSKGDLLEYIMNLVESDVSIANSFEFECADEEPK